MKHTIGVIYHVRLQPTIAYMDHEHFERVTINPEGLPNLAARPLQLVGLTRAAVRGVDEAKTTVAGVRHVKQVGLSVITIRGDRYRY